MFLSWVFSRNCQLDNIYEYVIFVLSLSELRLCLFVFWNLYLKPHKLPTVWWRMQRFAPYNEHIQLEIYLAISSRAANKEQSLVNSYI